MGISCGIQDIELRLRWWPLRVEWHVHIRVRAVSAVWLSHTFSIWPCSSMPKSTLVRYICKRLTSSISSMGMTTSTIAYHHGFFLQMTTQDFRCSNIHDKKVTREVWWWIRMPIHIISMMANTLYMSHMDVPAHYVLVHGLNLCTMMIYVW